VVEEEEEETREERETASGSAGTRCDEKWRRHFAWWRFRLCQTMDSPCRSIANRLRSISTTTHRASASSSFQVRYIAFRPPGHDLAGSNTFVYDDAAVNSDAADRSRDRFARPGQHNHTSCFVPSPRHAVVNMIPDQRLRP